MPPLQSVQYGDCFGTHFVDNCCNGYHGVSKPYEVLMFFFVCLLGIDRYSIGCEKKKIIKKSNVCVSCLGHGRSAEFTEDVNAMIAVFRWELTQLRVTEGTHYFFL